MTTSHNNKQQNDKQLTVLLNKITVPAKTDLAWAKLENDLFARLDNETIIKKKPARFFSFIPRVAVPYALAATLVVSLAGFGISFLSYKNVDKSSFASLVSLEGKVAIQWSGKGLWDTISTLETKRVLPNLNANTIISVLDKSSATMSLGKGSILKLYQQSSLVIRAATEREQICFLSNGSVLAKVNKRTQNQHFEVQTSSATCAIVGTIFKVDAQGALQTTLLVFEGKVKMTPISGESSQTTIVSTGQFMTMNNNGHALVKQHNAPLQTGTITDSCTPIRDISILDMLSEQNDNCKPTDIIVDITSDPEGAKVLINNLMIGTTPILVKKPYGNYSVSVIGTETAPWETMVTSGRDKVYTVKASLSENKIEAPTSSSAIVPIRKQQFISPEVQRQQSEKELRRIPVYLEALVAMSRGEYQKTLAILDSLSNSGNVDIKSRMCIMETINDCYKKLGNFNHVADALEERLLKAESLAEKGQLLWEIATLRANCLGDYQGAEMSLVEFLILQPDAMWAHNAYSKLAETQYFLNKFESAAETYKKHIATFPQDPDVDRSMYNLACIQSKDLNNCRQAAELYTQIINKYRNSKYRGSSLFHRAECNIQLGKIDDAMKDYKAYLALSPEGIWRSACIVGLKKNKIL